MFAEFHFCIRCSPNFVLISDVLRTSYLYSMFAEFHICIRCSPNFIFVFVYVREMNCALFAHNPIRFLVQATAAWHNVLEERFRPSELKKPYLQMLHTGVSLEVIFFVDLSYIIFQTTGKFTIIKL